MTSHRLSRHSVIIGIALGGAVFTVLGACGEPDEPMIETGVPDGACALGTRIGGFETALRDGFTSVQGTVESGVNPNLVFEVVAEDGACRLMRPPTLFCDPACGAGKTCDAAGMCVDTPGRISIGTVSVSGLSADVEMTASPPVFFYTNLGTLPHPGFIEGDELQLTASGDGDVAAFSLDARGIAALTSPNASVLLDVDQPVSLQWTVPDQPDLSEIHIDLNIAQHGGTPGWIECEVPDTGQFDLPVSLSNQLLDGGYSGFPSVILTRRSMDSVTTERGCVDWSVRSTYGFEVEIPGLISCSNNDECPDGQTCQGDLTCG